MIKIADILTENGWPFRENDRSIICQCPQCGKDEHLYIFKENNRGKCMKCGQFYNLETLIIAVTGCSREEAKTLVVDGQPVMANQPLDDDLGRIGDRVVIEKAPLSEFQLPYNFLKITDPEAVAGYEYMVKRGVRPEIMGNYDVRYSPTMERVIFPVYLKERCVGWQGRDITGKAELRYTSPFGFSKGKVFFGYDLLTPQYDRIIITEGPIDALKVAILGNSVCSMGKEISKDQIELIKNFNGVNKIYLGLDPDAFESFDKIAQFFEPKKKVFIMQPPEGRKDFGECCDKEILRSFLDAKKYGGLNLVSTLALKRRF